MLQKTNGVLDNTQQLTGNLAAIDVAGMTASINQTLANVNEMTRKLNSNEGTLGLLMRDPTLYQNLTATMADADSLLIDLKEHPKRYVHFSIFGSKTK
jgi:phospholipid/cholesterol/gamma-HCH transport system substrate-binding protein